MTLAILLRLFRALALGIAIHGVLFAALAWLPLVDDAPEIVQLAYFYGFIVPAMILAMPFTRLLWWLGLMRSPGWFAWPAPLGFVLAYGCWIAVLLALAWMIMRKAKGARRRPLEVPRR